MADKDLRKQNEADKKTRLKVARNGMFAIWLVGGALTIILYLLIEM